MAYVYSCDCGFVGRGDTSAEFIAEIEKHLVETHPDMVGRLTRDDILALAEET